MIHTGVANSQEIVQLLHSNKAWVICWLSTLLTHCSSFLISVKSAKPVRPFSVCLLISSVECWIAEMCISGKQFSPWNTKLVTAYCMFFYQIDDVTTFIHSCLFSKCQLVDRVYAWFIHPPPKYGTSLVSSDNLSPALHLSFFTLSPFICQKKKDWLITVNIYWQNNSWQIYRFDEEPRRLVCQIWILNRTDSFLRNTNQ